MDPVTATVLGAVGAGVSAIGTVAGGIAQSEQASYAAQVAKNNQQIANQNAEYSREAGAAATTAAGLKARAQEGSVKAAIAANNLDVNSGSAKQVEEGQAETGTLSELTADQQGKLQAYGYQTQATGYEAEARLQESVASNAIPASLLSAGGSILGNAGTLPLKYRWMSQNPVT